MMEDIKVELDEYEETEIAFRRKVEAIRKNIQEIPEPSYDERKWSDENLFKYVNEVKAKGRIANNGYKMFFLGDTGSVWQNEYIIAAVVWYLKNWFLPPNVLEKLLAYENVIFRVEAKVEQEPQSCIFIDRQYDLVQIAVERRDSKLLRKLVEYINFNDYPHFGKEYIYQIIEENIDVV